MIATFFSAMLIIILLVLILNNRKPKDYKNPLNPRCDRETCNGCQYYNNNVCEKE